LNLLVLDASVALHWVVPSPENELRQGSLRLFRRFVERELDFVVPDLFWAEVASVLCKGVRQQRWQREIAERAVKDLTEYGFQTVSSSMLISEALPIALNYGISLYDCLYVSLAMEAKTDLVTADERLANALAARFPVKWLGAF